MAHDRPFASTRRHFIQTAAAASAAGLWIPRAWAAGVPVTAAANTALELAGSTGEWLSSVTLPEHVSAPGSKGATFGLTPFHASLSVAAASKVLDWVMSPARGKSAASDGAVVVTDQNFKVMRRIEWTAGQITEVKFSKLSASDGKRPFAADFAWQPATVTHREADASKSAALPSASKAKALLASNFRLSGLPGDTTLVTAIELPTISAPSSARKGGESRAAAAGSFGELTIELSSRARESHYKFVHGVIQDGVLSDKERVDLTVELLDPTLKNTLATVKLGRCGFHSYKEAAFERNSEAAGRFTLTFSVESFDLKI